MKYYISREAAIEAVENRAKKQTNADVRKELMDAVIAVEYVKIADVQPVKHGKWIWNSNAPHREHGAYKCSNCGCHSDFEENYCYNCGARMDGDAE